MGNCKSVGEHVEQMQEEQRRLQMLRQQSRSSPKSRSFRARVLPSPTHQRWETACSDTAVPSTTRPTSQFAAHAFLNRTNGSWCNDRVPRKHDKALRAWSSSNNETDHARSSVTAISTHYRSQCLHVHRTMSWDLQRESSVVDGAATPLPNCSADHAFELVTTPTRERQVRFERLVSVCEFADQPKQTDAD